MEILLCCSASWLQLHLVALPNCACPHLKLVWTSRTMHVAVEWRLTPLHRSIQVITQ